MKRLIVVMVLVLLAAVAFSQEIPRVPFLLKAVTATGDGASFTIGSTTSKFTCHVTVGGTIPATVVVKLKGSMDEDTFDDWATDTWTTVEKVENGTFTGNATGWTLGAQWTYGDNKVAKGATGVTTLSQATADMTTAPIPGEVYLLQFEIVAISGGTITPTVGGVAGTAVSTTGLKQQSFTATATTGIVFTPSAAAMTCEIDNVALIRNEHVFHVVNKPAKYIKGSYVSKTGGDDDTTVTLKVGMGGN